MSRNSDPIQIVIHSPTTSAGRKSLTEQVAAAHAEQVRRYVQSLTIPSESKKRLVDAVLDANRWSDPAPTQEKEPQYAQTRRYHLL